MTSDHRWRFSLRLFLLIITVLGAVFGFLGVFVRWNVEQERLSQTIDPILTQHEVIIAVEQGSPKVAIGTVFEAAVTLGIPLLAEDEQGLAQLGGSLAALASVLPARTGRKPAALDDDF